MTNTSKMTVDTKLVDLAIEELRSTNQKVSIPNVAKVTGYTQNCLYYCGYLDKYKRERKSSKKNQPLSAIAKEKVFSFVTFLNTATEYLDYIKLNFFFRPESVEEVKLTLFEQFGTVNTTLFMQAINTLIVEKYIVCSTLKDKFIVAEKPVEAPRKTNTIYLVIDLDGKCHHQSDVQPTQDVLTGLLMSNPSLTLKVYESVLLATATMKVSVETKK